MNFIKQYNAFKDYRRKNHMPGKEELCWLRLFDQANDLGWPEWFVFDNPRFAVELGVTEKTLIDLRNKIAQRGLIEFIPGKKGKPTKYKLVRLYENTVNIPVNTTVETTVNTTGKTTVETTGIYKLKDKPKQKLEDEEECAQAQKALAMVMYNCDTLRSGFEMQEVNRWLNEFPTEVVMEAIRKIGLSGGEVKRPMTVIDRQLWEWRGKGLTTLDAIRGTYVSERPAMPKKETQRERVERLMQEREGRQASG